MKGRSMKSILAIVICLAFTSVGRGGDGTLPFGMKGHAADKNLSYSGLKTGPLPARSPKCSSGYTFEASKGTVTFGSSSYTIVGICKLGDEGREILAANGTETLKLAEGVLDASESPKTLSGTLRKGRLSDGSESEISTFKLVE